MPRERRPSLQSLQLLSAMLEDPAAEYYGLELGRALGLKSGTVYPALQRLEGIGWLESRPEDVDPSEAGRPRRRLYRLTRSGAAGARAEIAQLQRTLLRPGLAGGGSP